MRATMHREQQPFPRPHSPEPPRKPRRRRWRNFNVDSGDEGDCGVVERSCPFRCSRAGSRPVHVGFPCAPVGCCFSGACRRHVPKDRSGHPEPPSHPPHPSHPPQPPPRPHPAMAFPPPPPLPYFLPPCFMPQGMYLPPHHLMMLPPPVPIAAAASSRAAGAHPMPTSAEEVMRAHESHMSIGREVGPPKASSGVGPRPPTIVLPRSRGKRTPPASATGGTQIADDKNNQHGSFAAAAAAAAASSGGPAPSLPLPHPSHLYPIPTSGATSAHVCAMLSQPSHLTVLSSADRHTPAPRGSTNGAAQLMESRVGNAESRGGHAGGSSASANVAMQQHDSPARRRGVAGGHDPVVVVEGGVHMGRFGTPVPSSQLHNHHDVDAPMSLLAPSRIPVLPPSKDPVEVGVVPGNDANCTTSPAHPEPPSHPPQPPQPHPAMAFSPPQHHPFFFPPLFMPPQGMYLPPHHLMMQPPPVPMAAAASSMGAGGHPMPTSAEEVMRAHESHMSIGREVGPPKASGGVGPRPPTIVSPRSRGKRTPPASATGGTQIADDKNNQRGKQWEAIEKQSTPLISRVS
ncbi:unnamed protein product [Vitrella brassicaformis CCMP3155]|uniref:Uncharacterized protein n=1 Tax=Vitrella brassicaformis (strain CCMP3155) TaxID=1169540 RepID=A0A0G4ELQ4_VITBC|nr:unnamed protein product [Vitrella brassicaformis CCMP3155]|eukprot:CEL97902.1 unnamed protein product [Vitrella brassicaformis CCMP3155]